MKTSDKKRTGGILLSLLAIVTISSSGCSSLWISEPQPDAAEVKDDKTASEPAAKTTSVAINNLAEKRSSAYSDIEVLWQIPTEPVEGFVINYGLDKSNLDQKVKVNSQDLEKFEDSKYGFVYRYVLGAVPVSKTIYVSVAAFNGEEISKPSDAFEVKADSWTGEINKPESRVSDTKLTAPPLP